MKILIIISIIYSIQSMNDINKTLPVINMCGKIGEYKEPENETDCFKGNNTFGGKCCYVRFESINNEKPTKKSVCVAVPSISKKDIEFANEIAFSRGYSITVKCKQFFLNINLYILLIYFVIF